jgi:hypothetical protein
MHCSWSERPESFHLDAEVRATDLRHKIVPPLPHLKHAYDVLLMAGKSSARNASHWLSVEMDDAIRMRGRGWALITALNAYTSYAVSPRVAAHTTRQVTEVLFG